MDGYMKILGSRVPYKSWVHQDNRERDNVIMNLIEPNASVLNYGCGTDTLNFLKDIGCKPINYDIDTENSVADYHRLCDLPGQFDVTVLKEVIEHMTINEMKQAFTELYPYTKSILITTPNVFDTASRIWFEQDSTHIRPYNTSDLEGVFKACGYDKVKAIVCERIKAPHRNILAKINTTLPYAPLIVYASKT